MTTSSVAPGVLIESLKKKAPNKAASGSQTFGIQARAITTRNAILHAAIEVFAKHGFDGGRIELISTLAKTHDRMIYYYFGSKESLFVEVLKTIYQRMNDAEAALQIDLDDPVEALITVTHFMWQYYLDHPEFMTLLNTENLHQGQHLKKSDRVSELMSPGVGTLDRALRAGADKGVFQRGLRARDLYIAIAALGYFYLSNRHTLSAFLGEDLVAKPALKHWREFITNMVLRSVSL